LPPKLTVIIATYNWSEALRCSIASVLYQTFRDFELLVVGDACTDDSSAVVASFNDPRVAWHNLATRVGSQSGPNNFGIQIARGEYIAYLGHDDVWHPRHLEHLLSTVERTGAGIGCSIAAMYGPPGAGIRGLSGVFIEDKDRSSEFFPPSSMLHRRDLPVAQAGWRLPGEVSLPVDCDFVLRARACGAMIVSSRRLTVFKFNSAWRRDSYRRRETVEQQAILRQLTEDPAGCAETALVELLQANREKKLLENTMPDTTGLAPGALFHRYLRFRGLEAEELVHAPGQTRFHPAPAYQGFEWHEPEDNADWGRICWSGPALESTTVIPIVPSRPFHVRIRILNWFQVSLPDELALCVDGTPAAFSIEPSDSPAAELITELRPSTGQHVRVQFRVSRTRCPHFEWPGRSDDQRWMGVCVNWIELNEESEPVTGVS